MKKNKVIAAMSGGVDSSAAAAMLIDKGFEVTGVTFNQFNFDVPGFQSEILKNNFKKTIEDAKKVCEVLGIQHYVIDVSDDFRNEVVDYFVDEYLKGRTPNPCTKCNPTIKWDRLLDFADKIEAKYMATGHYANINYNEKSERYYLSKGADTRKDQTYMLWKLSQKQLSRTLFPLGKFNKTYTRELAKKYRLPVYSKGESQDICFLHDDDYHRFINEYAKEKIRKISQGDIVLDKKVIGRHKGFPFYTIGQRKGLGISHTEPVYVLNIDSNYNTLIVGEDSKLFALGLVAEDINMQKYPDFKENSNFSVRIRYRDSGNPADCDLKDGKMRITFSEPRRAVTPGQSVVVYEGDDIVAGGIIQEALKT